MNYITVIEDRISDNLVKAPIPQSPVTAGLEEGRQLRLRAGEDEDGEEGGVDPNQPREKSSSNSGQRRRER